MENKLKPNFFENVYEVVKLIPSGKVTSYGTIAAYLGSKGSARMVGWAMNNAHGNPEIPAHRVVNQKGLLTGKFHFEQSNTMQTLLESEGLIIENNQILNLENHFWNPQTELI